MPSVSTGAERRIMAGRVTPAPLAVMFVDFTAPTRLPPLPSGQGQRLAGGGRSATVAHGSIQGLRLLPCLPPTSDLLLCPPAHPAPPSRPQPPEARSDSPKPFQCKNFNCFCKSRSGIQCLAQHHPHPANVTFSSIPTSRSTPSLAVVWLLVFGLCTVRRSR